MTRVQSWNRQPRVAHARLADLDVRRQPLPLSAATRLVHGQGRSYGDVCLNPDGELLLSRSMDRFIAFDRARGRLVCEAGVTLAAILDFIVPQGWFLPVTPGTRYVSVGGAIANDVHGKNHHVAGSFGHHVVRFELLRSDGERRVCSPTENPAWFRASVGGLGLTGAIVWAELQLIPVHNAWMTSETVRFGSLDAFWEINAASGADWPYTVAWIDCTARGAATGRGHFIRARHAPPQPTLPAWCERSRTFPFDPPVSLLSRPVLKAFNTAYYHRPLPSGVTLAHYVPYFYPLDAIRHWNRLYGRRGFFQYQCVLPPDASRDGIRALLERIARHGAGSFLAVLKTFGAQAAPGMLSFARPGATLALDFSNSGARLHELFRELDAVVSETGGALYPAKDARMPGALFRAAYPELETFCRHLDPGFSSGFWRRVME